MKNETKEWVTIAKEDKDIAESMWRRKQYVYTIMFWQQAVEKLLKAYIVEVQDVLPFRTHDIDLLLKQAKLFPVEELAYKDAKELTLAFTRTRYEDLSRKHYSKKVIVEPLVIQAEILYIWTEKQLKYHLKNISKK